jgi:DME family drug/metabolite transporter
MSVAALGTTVVVLPFLPGRVLPVAAAWPWLAYLGVATTTVALLAFAWGAARLTPTALTVATLLEPLTTVVLAAVLLAQPLAPVAWVGAALLLGALVGLGSTGGADRVHDGGDTETTLGT